MTDEVGLCDKIIERMTTMRVGVAGGVANGFSGGLWTDSRVSLYKTAAKLVTNQSASQNHSHLTYDALIELQQRASSEARQTREQHKGVQRERVYSMRNPLDSMLVRSLTDLKRFSDVKTYYEIQIKSNKPHRAAVEMMLEHKAFSGSDVPLSDLYEQNVRRIQGWADEDETHPDDADLTFNAVMLGM
jgi:hypothetical protein